MRCAVFSERHRTGEQRLSDDLEQVERIVKHERVSWPSSEDFTAQPFVLNGASELAAEIFGDKGLHARVAVGVSELPHTSAL